MKGLSEVSKVKVTTVSGTVIEKPVVTCFKNNVGSYLVLDNEKNGTMGLPIILVCRLFNNKLTKIVDQGEWQTVKENLKSIISGNNIDYENVADDLIADDVYYTQLTLPANSFEVLKNAYVQFASSATPSTPTESAPTEPEVQAPPVEPVVAETPVVEVAPVVEPVVPAELATPDVQPEVSVNPEVAPVAPGPAPVEPAVAEVAPVAPVVEPNVSDGLQVPNLEPVAPEQESPEMPEVPNPVMPDIPNAPVDSTAPVEPVVAGTPVVEVAPAIEPVVSEPASVEPAIAEAASVVPEVAPAAPVVETPTQESNPSDINEIKESFMKACENMFDALIIKFEQK